MITSKYNFTKELNKFISQYDFVTSSYLYGSYLRKPETANDIDFLLIIKNDTNLDKLKDMSDKINKKWPKVEVTTILEYEANNFIHQGFSSFYYFNLNKNHVLISGKNVLSNLPNVSLNSTLNSISVVAQRARNSVVNNDYTDINFLGNKINIWLLNFAKEVIFIVYGEYYDDRKDAFKRLMEVDNEFKNFSFNSDFYQKVKFLHHLEMFLILNLTKNCIKK